MEGNKAASSLNISGSLVRINTIAIDINCAPPEEIEPELLNQLDDFKIRGYVSSEWTRNPNACSPFVDDDSAGGNGANAIHSSFHRNDTEGNGGIQQTGDENRWYDSVYAEDGNLNDTMIVYNPQGIETYVAKGGNPLHIQANPPNTAEANPLPIQENRRNATVESSPILAARPRRTSLRKGSGDRNPKRLCSMQNTTEKVKKVMFDIPVVQNSTKSPQRKENGILLEGVAEKPCPSKRASASEGFQSPTPDAEETRRRIEVSNLELDSAAVLLGLRDISMALPTNLDKNKPVDISRKTTRQTKDSSESINAIFDQARSRCIAEVELRLPHPLSITTIDRFCNPSKGKTLVYESRYNPLKDPRKCTLERRSTNGEVGLDLTIDNFFTNIEKNIKKSSSSKQKILPDLNKAFTERPSRSLGRQLALEAWAKKTSSSCIRPLEMAASSSKDQLADIDDVPMEVVDLMARNQRERERGSSVQESPNSAFYPYRRRCPPIDLPSGNECNGHRGKRSNAEGSQFGFLSPVGPIQQKEKADTAWFPKRDNPPIIKNYSGGIPTSSSKSGAKRSIWDNMGRMAPRFRSMNYHSNETTPAMQLMSLMDRGIGPSSSSVPNTFSDSYGQLQENESRKDLFLNGSLFSQNKLDFGLGRPINGAYYPGESSKKSESQGQMNGTYQPGESLKRSELPFKTNGTYERGECSKKRSELRYKINEIDQHGESSDKSVLQGQIDGTYHSGESSKGYQLRGKKRVEQGSSSKAVSRRTLARRAANLLKVGPCVINRNPADFTTPDEGKYTVKNQDLGPRKKTSATKRGGDERPSEPKNQRLPKRPRK